MPPPKNLADVLGLTSPANANETHPDAVTVTDLPALCRGVITSRQWLDMIQRQITLNELPPALSIKLMEYGWGKPMDQIAVTTTVRYDHLPMDELAARTATILATLQELSAQIVSLKKAHAVPVEEPTGDEPLDTVH